MSKNSKFAIWVPAKREHGLGHFYRNYFLYESIKDSFFFFNEKPEYSLEERSLTCLSKDSEELLGYFKKENIEFLLIDHYFLEETTLLPILSNKNLNTLIFYKKDITPINNNIFNNNPFVDENYIQNDQVTTSFLGSKYFSFRSDIEKFRDNQKIADKVFICFGGGDNHQLSLKIIRKLDQTLYYNIILGQACSDDYLAEVNNEFKKHKLRGEVYHNPQNFFELLSTSSKAIISSSTLSYESSFLNTPFISINTASNQNEIVHFLIERNIPVIDLKSFDNLNTISEILNQANCIKENWGENKSQIIQFIKDRLVGKSI